MDDFFVSPKDYPVASEAVESIMEAYAQYRNVYVSPRGQIEFYGEEGDSEEDVFFSHTSTLSSEELDNYMRNGGIWEYVPARLWLAEYFANEKELYNL